MIKMTFGCDVNKYANTVVTYDRPDWESRPWFPQPHDLTLTSIFTQLLLASFDNFL